jgi:hypothetical protein
LSDLFCEVFSLVQIQLTQIWVNSFARSFHLFKISSLKFEWALLQPLFSFPKTAHSNLGNLFCKIFLLVQKQLTQIWVSSFASSFHLSTNSSLKFEWPLLQGLFTCQKSAHSNLSDLFCKVFSLVKKQLTQIWVTSFARSFHLSKNSSLKFRFPLLQDLFTCSKSAHSNLSDLFCMLFSLFQKQLTQIWVTSFARSFHLFKISSLKFERPLLRGLFTCSKSAHSNLSELFCKLFSLFQKQLTEWAVFGKEWASLKFR